MTGKRKNRKPYTGIFLLGMLLCMAKQPAMAIEGWPKESPGEERHKGMFSVTEEVVTPHIPWAKPLKGKKVKALFIIPRWSGREVAELAQRMPLQYNVAMLAGPGKISGLKESSEYLSYSAERPGKTLQRIRTALKFRYDVILLGNIYADILPQDIWQKIEMQVTKGTGLIITGNKADDSVVQRLLQSAVSEALPESIKSSVPYVALPAFMGEAKAPSSAIPAVEVYRLGRGRLVLPKYAVMGKAATNSFICPPHTITEHLKNGCAYDYYQSMAVKLLLLAAGRNPSVALDAVAVTPAVIDRGKLSALQLNLIGSDKAACSRINLQIRLRSIDGAIHLERSFKPSGNKLSPFLADNALPIGRYFIDAALHDNRGNVLNWASSFFDVSDNQGVAGIVIREKQIKPGELISGRINLKQPLQNGDKLLLEVGDSFGRITARQILERVAGTSIPFSLPSGNLIALAGRIRVELLSQDKRVDSCTAQIPVRQPAAGPGWDDYSLMVWGFTDAYFRHFIYEDLQKEGMDRLMTMFASVEEHARQAGITTGEYNCRPFLYGYHIPSVQYCKPEPIRERFTRYAEALYPFNCSEYSLGDESNLAFRGKTDKPLDNKEINQHLQKYLQRIYPSLEAVNNEWNTSFTNWSEVCGITLEEAVKNNQEARWVDHRLHLDEYFTEAMIAGEERVGKIDPEARTGFEGAFQTESYRGYDWGNLFKHMKLMGSYWMAPMEIELAASFKKPDTYWGFWNGSYIDIFNRDTQRWIPWRCLLWGMNSIWYWSPYFDVRPLPEGDLAFGLYLPDLRPNPVARPFLDGVQEIKNGPGKLLITSERRFAPIAVHYSQPSIHASTLSNGGFLPTGAGCPTRIYSSWMTALWSFKEIGLQPQFIASEQIEEGGLSNYKILILPFSQALTLQESRQIHKFVESGGLVVADVLPAIRNRHGKLLDKGLLDDLFGIERLAGRKAGELSDIRLNVMYGQPVSGTLPSVQIDPAVRATTGKALQMIGDTPVFIEHKIGKGKALLLNFTGNYTPGSYRSKQTPPIRTTPRGDLYLDIAHRLAAAAGVTPELTVSSGDERLRGIDIVSWKDGSASYFGFTPNDYCDYAWVLTMPRVMKLHGKVEKSGHLYDIRCGRYLGYGNTFNMELQRGSAALLANLPYKVSKVTITGPVKVRQGKAVEFVLAVAAEGGKAGRHILHVEVSANGKSLKHYAANIEAKNGQGIYRLPVALNDMPGSWTITARDTVSGIRGRASFRIEEANSTQS